ncbi:hypothetical protein SAMN05216275_11788 [Streptosporangium canum]|uniref:Uncharacterized protein n=1 Tax=Streptosporangium canum TaxID=324952 RepID=A0A1I3WT03_9ACTN|nr:hypothetical protein [Streptosporangium canum]SFK09977.1 hypothetical protein SAMN05216275_11788 [Streptosporangium canum]
MAPVFSPIRAASWVAVFVLWVVAVVLLSRVVSARSVAAAEEASDRPAALHPA